MLDLSDENPVCEGEGMGGSWWWMEGKEEGGSSHGDISALHDLVSQCKWMLHINTYELIFIYQLIWRSVCFRDDMVHGMEGPAQLPAAGAVLAGMRLGWHAVRSKSS